MWFLSVFLLQTRLVTKSENLCQYSHSHHEGSVTNSGLTSTLLVDYQDSRNLEASEWHSQNVTLSMSNCSTKKQANTMRYYQNPQIINDVTCCCCCCFLR